MVFKLIFYTFFFIVYISFYAWKENKGSNVNMALKEPGSYQPWSMTD